MHGLDWELGSYLSLWAGCLRGYSVFYSDGVVLVRVLPTIAAFLGGRGVDVSVVCVLFGVGEGWGCEIW